MQFEYDSLWPVCSHGRKLPFIVEVTVGNICVCIWLVMNHNFQFQSTSTLENVSTYAVPLDSPNSVRQIITLVFSSYVVLCVKTGVHENQRHWLFLNAVSLPVSGKPGLVSGPGCPRTSVLSTLSSRPYPVRWFYSCCHNGDSLLLASCVRIALSPKANVLLLLTNFT